MCLEQARQVPGAPRLHPSLQHTLQGADTDILGGGLAGALGQHVGLMLLKPKAHEQTSYMH